MDWEYTVTPVHAQNSYQVLRSAAPTLHRSQSHINLSQHIILLSPSLPLAVILLSYYNPLFEERAGRSMSVYSKYTKY